MTAVDVVYCRYSSRPLELAVAATSVVAIMLYVALQLVDTEMVINSLGLTCELPLAVVFVILALNVLGGHARASADRVREGHDARNRRLVAVVLVPMKLGGYAHVFDVASAAYTAKKSGGLCC